MDIDAIGEGPLPVAIQTDTGKKSQGTGQVRINPAGSRGAKAGGLAVAALLLMTFSIAPPGPHALIMLPLSFILLYVAFSIWRVRSKLVDIQTSCPGCEAQVTLEGGPLAAKMEDQCPECQRPLALTPGKEA